MSSRRRRLPIGRWLRRARRYLLPILVVLAGVLVYQMLKRPVGQILETLPPSLSKITTPAILDVCEADFTAIRSGERDQVHAAWPDGHTTAWVNIPGRVTAGVDLGEMEVSGSRDELEVHLPRPTVTGCYPDYGGIEWDHHSGFWTTDPDGSALDFREDLITGAITILPQLAEASGLLEEAETNLAVSVSRIVSAIGIDEINVITGSGRVLPMGTSNSPGSVQPMEAQVNYRHMSEKLVLVIVLTVFTLIAGFIALRGGSGRGLEEASASAISQNVTEEVVFSNLKQLSSLNCGDYSGAVFVRNMVPLRLLGMRIGEAQIWMSTPGTVRSAVDLSGLERTAVRQTGTGDHPVLSINLPEPIITGTELYPADGIQGRSPMLLLGGNAEAVAQAEDGLKVDAQMQLEEQARQAGLLEQARASAEATIRGIVRQLLGDPSLEVEVSFESTVPFENMLPVSLTSLTQRN